MLLDPSIPFRLYVPKPIPGTLSPSFNKNSIIFSPIIINLLSMTFTYIAIIKLPVILFPLVINYIVICKNKPSYVANNCPSLFLPENKYRLSIALVIPT
jgi:hypothetical protein